MSLLYSSNFRYPEGDNLRKNQGLFMDSSPHYNHQQHQQEVLQQQNNNQQHQQNNSRLMRYRSAPSSFFDSLVNGSSSGGGEDYQYFRSSSPEIDTFIAKHMLPSNNSDDSGSHDLQQFGEKSMNQEEAETTTTKVPPQNGYSNGASSQMIYQSLQVRGLQRNNDNNNNNNTTDNSFGVTNSMVLESKMATGNGSNLIRQSSSPAGLFSNLGVDNGSAGMSDVGCFRGGNVTNGESGASTSRLNNNIDFSTGQRLNMPPQIGEIGNQNMGTHSREKGLGSNNGSSRQYMSNFASDSWDDSSFNGLKRARETDGNMYFGFSTLETQNGTAGSRSYGLTHHLSLPKTSSEMAAVGKFLHFQGSIPCKIRAKRGCATHPRSIAERVRRTRISERMRKLQDLFPNMDKQTNTADMLDLAVEYIKDLQKQVKTLTYRKAKCMCSQKQKQ